MAMYGTLMNNVSDYSQFLTVDEIIQLSRDIAHKHPNQRCFGRLFYYIKQLLMDIFSPLKYLSLILDSFTSKEESEVTMQLLKMVGYHSPKIVVPRIGPQIKSTIVDHSTIM
ncbi:hypothetical protein I4U23_010939 [Adineta vaga]|nr:hypothetical protein I4U23_010939 [Adineta vaga]